MIQSLPQKYNLHSEKKRKKSFKDDSNVKRLRLDAETSDDLLGYPKIINSSENQNDSDANNCHINLIKPNNTC